MTDEPTMIYWDVEYAQSLGMWDGESVSLEEFSNRTQKLKREVERLRAALKEIARMGTLGISYGAADYRIVANKALGIEEGK